jgi:hypothetical protein
MQLLERVQAIRIEQQRRHNIAMGLSKALIYKLRRCAHLTTQRERISRVGGTDQSRFDAINDELREIATREAELEAARRIVGLALAASSLEVTRLLGQAKTLARYQHLVAKVSSSLSGSISRCRTASH